MCRVIEAPPLLIGTLDARNGALPPPEPKEPKRMPTKIAINGFGRIGRCIVRALHERNVKDVELVAINDLTDAKTLAHLYNYDSVHGRADPRATAHEGALEIDGRHIKILA